MARPPKVRSLNKKEGEQVEIHRFPNFSKSGSVKGMRKRYYGRTALLVQCGSFIYNVSSEPSIYDKAK